MARRVTLLLLEDPDGKDHQEKLDFINETLSREGIPQRFGFSANVGEFGGFVTENEKVFEAIKKEIWK